MRTTIFFLILLVGIIGVHFFLPSTNEPEQSGQFSWSGAEPVRAEAVQAFILPVSQASYLPVHNSSVSDPMLDAKSVLLYDMRSGRTLFEKQTSDRLPVASLTKVISALVTLDLFPVEETVTVPPEAVKVDDEKQELYAQEQLTVQDLLQLMLVGSSNDAAYALALHAKERGIDFVARMNEKARELEMSNSQFFDPAGLNDQGYSTSRDIVKLMLAALKKKELWPATREPEITIQAKSGQVHVIKNTNQLLNDVPSIVAGKTGYTDGALGCLILAVKLSEKDAMLLSVVLGSHERFTDTDTLIDWALMAYRWE